MKQLKLTDEQKQLIEEHIPLVERMTLKSPWQSVCYEERLSEAFYRLCMLAQKWKKVQSFDVLVKYCIHRDTKQGILRASKNVRSDSFRLLPENEPIDPVNELDQIEQKEAVALLLSRMDRLSQTEKTIVAAIMDGDSLRDAVRKSKRPIDSAQFYKDSIRTKLAAKHGVAQRGSGGRSPKRSRFAV